MRSEGPGAHLWFDVPTRSMPCVVSRGRIRLLCRACAGFNVKLGRPQPGTAFNAVHLGMCAKLPSWFMRAVLAGLGTGVDVVFVVGSFPKGRWRHALPPFKGDGETGWLCVAKPAGYPRYGEIRV